MLIFNRLNQCALSFMRKLPTISEIARQLKVSASTVSRALHDHPSIGLHTKTRVKNLARELRYEPIQTAINFKQRRTHTIGVIVPYLSEHFFAQAVSGIEDAAFQKEYNVLIAQSHDSLAKEEALTEAFRRHRVDGMLVSVSKETKKIPHFTALKEYNIPVVFFDRAPEADGISKVTCDLYQSSVKLIEFLYKQKHRKIALIRGPHSLASSSERMKGFVDGLAKKRLKANPAYITHTDLTRESTWKAVKELLQQKHQPTAIIAFNDFVALDAIQYIKLHTPLRVNKDICFVSYANLPFCKYLEDKPVASVEQYPYLQGSQAVDLLLQLIENEDSLPLQATVECNIILA